MAELNELMERFYARGCPKHKRLRYCPGQRIGERNQRGPHWYFNNHAIYSAQFEVHSDDARAILTLWVLKWWLGSKPKRKPWKPGWQFMYVWKDKAQAVLDCGGNPYEPEFLSDDCPGILEAVEEASRHLEPK